VTGDRRKGAQQQDLFSEADAGLVPEPVLMGLHPEYYELIWRGLKRHEFRRRFVEGRPARWFVYLNTPPPRSSRRGGAVTAAASSAGAGLDA
jgi:hypothetical protein